MNQTQKALEALGALVTAHQNTTLASIESLHGKIKSFEDGMAGRVDRLAKEEAGRAGTLTDKILARLDEVEKRLNLLAARQEDGNGLAAQRVEVPALLVERIEAVNERLDRIEQAGGIVARDSLVERIRKAAAVALGVAPSKGPIAARPLEG